MSVVIWLIASPNKNLEQNLSFPGFLSRLCYLPV